MRAQVGLIVVAVLVGSAGCDLLKKKEAEPTPVATTAPAQPEGAITDSALAPPAEPTTVTQKVTPPTRPLTTTTSTGNGLQPIGPIGANTTTKPPTATPPPTTTTPARPPPTPTTTPPPPATTPRTTTTGRGVPPPPGGRPKPGTK
jgi:hypothetical protein